MSKFRKLPVVIDAFLWSGNAVDAYELGKWQRSFGPIEHEAFFFPGDGTAQVRTLEDGKNGEAKHVADAGDWIIRGVKGEFYPCKPDIFAATYEPAEG
jgi:hypothetical protein